MITHVNKFKRNKFPCFINNCDKSFLYTCTLKKHIMTSHEGEFKKILNEYPNENFFEISKKIKDNKNLEFVKINSFDNEDEKDIQESNINNINYNEDIIIENDNLNLDLNEKQTFSLNKKIEDERKKELHLKNNNDNQNNILNNIINNNFATNFLNLNNDYDCLNNIFVNNLMNFSPEDIFEYTKYNNIRENSSRKMQEIINNSKNKKDETIQNEEENNLLNSSNNFLLMNILYLQHQNRENINLLNYLEKTKNSVSRNLNLNNFNNLFYSNLNLLNFSVDPTRTNSNANNIITSFNNSSESSNPEKSKSPNNQISYNNKENPHKSSKN